MTAEVTLRCSIHLSHVRQLPSHTQSGDSTVIHFAFANIPMSSNIMSRRSVLLVYLYVRTRAFVVIVQSFTGRHRSQRAIVCAMSDQREGAPGLASAEMPAVCLIRSCARRLHY